ncbi:LysR family transcriptional regulator [Rhodophyticola sp.]|jgi:DNA-binding transcriptional LysR family regulator|uniref:LysR family transcriptional regulator n=1 Tax=Rhodophyticola sp. TaxID=2680032 RepID=UPI003D2ACB19
MSTAPISLNKLLVLDEILTSGSISKAAGRLNRTQPSVSKTLGDLRAFYDDPLLIREGGGLVPTPFAMTLMEALAAWRRDGDGLLSMRSRFDLGTTRRHFVIRASDYHLTAFGPVLQDAAFSAIPTLSFEFRSPVGTLSEDFRQWGFDFAFRVNAISTSTFGAREILSEPYVILFDPKYRTAPTNFDEFCSAVFVLASATGSGPSKIDIHLARIGRTRTVGIRVSRISDVARFVLASPFVSVVPKSAAMSAISSHSLQMAPLFFDVPKVTSSLVWPTSRASDPAVEWLSDKIVSAMISTPDCKK